MSGLPGRSRWRWLRRAPQLQYRARRDLAGWLRRLRQTPGRYTLHGVALVVGATVMLATPLVSSGRAGLRGANGASNAPALATSVEAASRPTAAPSVTQASRPARPFSYTVQPGDTLRGIAERFDISLETLLWNNSLEDPDVLRPGQELVVLPTSGVLHPVRSGETLRQVAEQYHVSIDELIKYNDLPDPDRLAEGVKLVVPGGRPLPSQVAEAPPTDTQAGEEAQVAALGELSALPANTQNAVAAAPAAAPSPTPKPTPKTIVYEVKPGDTLNLLTQLFGIDMQTILDTNDIDDADSIQVGTKLRILPVSGLEHEVSEGETLADIAATYQVDMGPILDFNDLPNPDVIRIGMKLIVPGAKRPKPAPAPAPQAPAPPAPEPPAPEPPAPAPQEAPPEPPAAKPQPAPPPPVSGKGGAIVENAMGFLGYPYVFGGTSPSGFDCSGFVWYVYKISGNPISRGMWGQLNAGPRIPREQLSPGDIVFFANTYMPGLSHNGIYIGDGKFIHASDPSTGVVISSMSSSYWASRYVGASRP